jgi:flagellar protein FliL
MTRQPTGGRDPDVAESAPAAQQQEKEKTKGAEESPPKKPRKKIVLVAACVIALGVLGGGGYFGYKTFLKGGKPAKAGDAVVEGVKAEAHNPEEAAKAEAAKAKEPGKGEGGHGGGKEGEKPAEEPSLIFSLPNAVMTNLKGTTRRVIAQVWVEAVDAEGLATFKKSEPYIMDALVMVLSGKALEDVTTQEGKEMLQKEIKLRLEKMFEKNIVKRVGFTSISTI